MKVLPNDMKISLESWVKSTITPIRTELHMAESAIRLAASM